MKLRYRKTADLFVPQYFITKEDKWEDFKIKNLPKVLHNFCIALTNLENPRRFDSIHPRSFSPSEGEKLEDMSLIFGKEMYIMAFLGAAKSIYNTDTINFEL